MKSPKPSNAQLKTKDPVNSIANETELEPQQDQPVRDKKRRFKWASRRGRIAGFCSVSVVINCWGWHWLVLLAIPPNCPGE